jgi:hypothetical protein
MADSRFDPARLRRARALLMAPPAPTQRLGAVAAAAAFFAASAVGLAVTVVLLPTPWPMR